MNPNKQKEADLERVRRATRELLEFFDAVQIFASRSDGEKGTVHVSFGLGNWFARRGQVGEWILKEDQSSRLSVKPDDEE